MTTIVKPLVWDTYFGRDDLWCANDMPDRLYTIQRHTHLGRPLYTLLRHGSSPDVLVYVTLAGAKSAAQRTWKRIILSYL